jgi:hypothetical protein
MNILYQEVFNLKLAKNKKNVTPKNLCERDQAKKHRTHTHSLMEPSNTGYIMA